LLVQVEFLIEQIKELVDNQVVTVILLAPARCVVLAAAAGRGE
jgi:hypothetical protein